MTAAAQHRMGFEWTPESYQRLPLLPKTRNLNTLPYSASLLAYCPSAGNQGPTQTCAAWASVYGAATISYAKKNNIQHPTSQSFAPGFTYRLTKPDDLDCQSGVTGDEFLNLIESLSKIGMVRKQDFQDTCPSSVSDGIRVQAETFRIQGCHRLFNYDDSSELKMDQVKLALSKDYPVIIGMKVPQSFQQLTKPLWEFPPNASGLGGHAMCVVGYDDEKYDGAFQILNSWGENWGEKGFFWVKYSDFGQYTPIAFQLNDKTKVYPNPQEPTLSGALRFELRNKTPMPLKTGAKYGYGEAEVNPNPNAPAFLQFHLEKSYASGTAFRCYLANQEPCYIYIIATDNTLKINQLYPRVGTTSDAAAVPYKGVELPYPGEKSVIKLDYQPGTDVFCMLYSKDALDIAAILEALNADTQPRFTDRLHRVLGSKIVDFKDIQLSNNPLQFKSFSKTKTVLPILVLIPHE